jgi:hypothetical protein
MVFRQDLSMYRFYQFPPGRPVSVQLKTDGNIVGQGFFGFAQAIGKYSIF